MAKTDKTAVKEANATEETIQEMVQDYETLFDEKAKAEAFDKIAKLYYEHNFGNTSKSDIDLLMFHLYLNQLPEGSDYTVSKNLAITQQRIRGLRVKRQLKYGAETNYDWKKRIAEILEKSGSYDTETKRVSILVKDPNLFIEIENFLEEQTGGFVDYQLNKKILQLRVEYFLILMLEIVEKEEGVEKKEEIIKRLKTNCKDYTLDPKHLGRDLLHATLNIASFMASISTLVSQSNPIFSALKSVIGF